MSAIERVFEGVTLRVDGEEPLIRDLELGRVLEYADPVAVRLLIKRNQAKLGVVFTLKTTSGPLGGRPAEEFWLTREQALLVTAWSQTPKAVQATRHVIRVFLAAMDGRLVNAEPGREMRAALARDLLDIRAEIAMVRAEQQRGFRAVARQVAAIGDDRRRATFAMIADAVEGVERVASNVRSALRSAATKPAKSLAKGTDGQRKLPGFDDGDGETS